MTCWLRGELQDKYLNIIFRWGYNQKVTSIYSKISVIFIWEINDFEAINQGKEGGESYNRLTTEIKLWINSEYEKLMYSSSDNSFSTPCL